MSSPGIGTTVPELVRTLDLPDLVAYAGATWDWHRLHYDAAYIAAAGLPGPVVDGQMLGALLAEHVQDWAGPSSFIASMSFRFKAMVHAGETVRVVGQVHSVDERDDGSRIITIGQRVLVGDRIAIDAAQTTVRLPE